MIIRDKKTGVDAADMPVWLVVAVQPLPNEPTGIIIVDSRKYDTTPDWRKPLTPPITLHDAKAMFKLLQGATQSWT